MVKPIYKLLLLGFLLISLSALVADDIMPIAVKNDNLVDARDVLAEFDSGQILRKDVQNKISKLPPNIQGRYQTVEGQLQVLEIMATEEVFYLKARELGLDKSEDILERIAQLDMRYYLQEYYKRNVSDLVLLNAAEKNEFYQENQSLFYMYPNLTLHYIQAADEKEALAAKKELEAGALFADVSDKYNQNTYAKGLKGLIKNVRLNGNIPGLGNDAQLEAFIQESTVDENRVYGPYQTNTGWHLFRTVAWVEGRMKEYLEVEPEIEQRLRPIKERELLDALSERLMAKYKVVLDEEVIAKIDLANRKNNAEIKDELVLSSPNPDLHYTVEDVLNVFNKVSPQEQIFYIKGGGATQLVNQELNQKLLFLAAKDDHYERFFDENEEYLQMKQNIILRKAFEVLVLDTIEISDEEISDYYEQNIESYQNPAQRAIQVLFFDKTKTAKKALKKFAKAHKKNNEVEMGKIISKYSLKPEKSIYDNQYDNGVVTGLAPDADFSRQIWANPVGYLSPVFTASNGEVVFFRILSEKAKEAKSLTEVQPRIYGVLRQAKEKGRQEQVTEELYVEYNLKKYPERIRLNLTADELFEYANNASRNRKYQDAIVFFDQIETNFPNGVDDYKAAFMKAFLVAEEMKNTELAVRLFNSFLAKYPEGDLHESARFMIDSLEGRIDGFEDFE